MDRTAAVHVLDRLHDAQNRFYGGNPIVIAGPFASYQANPTQANQISNRRTGDAKSPILSHF